MDGAIKYFGEWQQRSVVCEPLRPGDSISLENKLTYDLRYNLNLYWDKE